MSDGEHIATDRLQRWNTAAYGNEMRKGKKRDREEEGRGGKRRDQEGDKDVKRIKSRQTISHHITLV